MVEITYKCPSCGRPACKMARVDSDDRIESTWLACHVCGYDQRQDVHIPDERSTPT